jgi:hypothetical protein
MEMTGNNKENLMDGALDPIRGVERPKNGYRGPALEGWASFGWQALTNSAPPSRSHQTVTRMFHRPRRVR